MVFNNREGCAPKCVQVNIPENTKEIMLPARIFLIRNDKSFDTDLHHKTNTFTTAFFPFFFSFFLFFLSLLCALWCCCSYDSDTYRRFTCELSTGERKNYELHNESNKWKHLNWIIFLIQFLCLYVGLMLRSRNVRCLSNNNTTTTTTTKHNNKWVHYISHSIKTTSTQIERPIFA